jgi:hypothetical protein
MGQPCSSVSGLDEGIALTGDYRVARAAFVEAVKHRPGGGETARLYADFKFDWRSNPNSWLIPSIQPGLVRALNDQAFFVSDSPKK